MSLCPPGHGLGSPRNRWFATTQWSVVLAARDGKSSHATEAMEQLCRTYWYPLYAYVRRRGHSVHDAQDLTQEFFARLLKKNYLSSVDRAKGKFRSFLLASVNHFLSDEWDRARAEQRGGKLTFILLDNGAAEDRYLHEPATPNSPEKLFERRWALTVLDQALARLRQRFVTANRLEEFDVLKVYLGGDVPPGEYERVGARLRMSPGAVAVAVHRLRQTYRRLVQREVAQTVADPGEVEDEMNHLFRVVSDSSGR